MTKIAAITDIHGNLAALQAVLKDIEDEGVDLIVNCGDTLGHSITHNVIYPSQVVDLTG